MRKILVLLAVFVLMAGFADAAERGTAKEAQSMVKKAVAFYKKMGRDKATAEFGNPKGKFIEKDLYISVYDMNGVVVSHPYNRGLIGKNVLALKDPDGKMFIKEFVDKAKADNSGWVSYKYTHPQTKKVESKKAYFEKTDGLIIQVGAYE